ncbi:protein mono-ADP-ribosyltransferase PARP16-like [Sitophilus oryzae]|uniref:Protein mono-ADP-ribosyltransferase PARP16-like n=1 Tax=Sitophilus oryzae TaxID=7048 RepID=A0A6J2XD01_SITOR|nr:protein mono-ADP-ribosyltransferase PARP16-like [Sitophilus oryzae]
MNSDEANLLDLEDKVNVQGEESCSQNNLHFTECKKIRTNEYAAKIEQLKEIIKKNVLGCDLTVCIFIAALKSYRVDGCLRPFPHYFINENNEKDFSSLQSACDKLPSLRDFVTLPTNILPKDVVNLLVWLFLESSFPVLSPSQLNEIPISVGTAEQNNVIPHFVFKVYHSKRSEGNWIQRVDNRDTFYAFHGSSIHNFYSILKFGLQPHFSNGKEVLFGSGIYLSSEISVCTNYASYGETWKKSSLGTKHSIIAVAEIINDHEEVKCKDKNNKGRSFNQDSYGEIPEKYFVVTNSELLRVKYLLVYTQKRPNMVKSFIKTNFLWIIITLYFLLLVFIGFLNGPYWQKILRYLSIK